MAGTRRVVTWLTTVKRGFGSALAWRIRSDDVAKRSFLGRQFLLHALLLLILALIVRYRPAAPGRGVRVLDHRHRYR